MNVFLDNVFLEAFGSWRTHQNLDGPAIRDANRTDSREPNRANRSAEKKNYFHNVRAIRANRIRPVIRNF